MQPSFRLARKSFFLTYPQAEGLTKQKIQNSLKKQLGDFYKASIICQENHMPQNDDDNIGIHFHVCLFLNREKNVTNQRIWDIKIEERTYHPNIQSMRSKPASIKYVNKYDEDVLEDNIDSQAYIKSTTQKNGYTFQKCVPDIKKDLTIEELWEDDQKSSFVLQNKRKIEEAIQLQVTCKRIKKKLEFPGLPLPPIEYPERQEYIQAINQKMTTPVKYGDKHIWVYGVTKTGKSMPLKEQLPEWFSSYSWTYENEKQHIDMLSADYILIDEFKGMITAGNLITLLDMSLSTYFPIRYSSAGKMKKKVPVFITSQHSPKRVFHNLYTEDKETYNALMRRLTVIKLVDQYPEETEISKEQFENIQQMEDEEDYEDQLQVISSNNNIKLSFSAPVYAPHQRDTGPKKPKNYKDLPLVEKQDYRIARKEWNKLHPKKKKRNATESFPIIQELYPEDKTLEDYDSEDQGPLEVDGPRSEQEKDMEALYENEKGKQRKKK